MLAAAPPRLLALGLALILGGCAGNPVQEGQRLLAPVPAAQLSEARALDAKGDAAGAAKYYLDLSEKAKPPTREQLRIEAARSLVAAGQARDAARVLDATASKAMTEGQRQVVLLLGAEAALQLGQARQAIERLERVQTFTLPAELRIRRLGTLAAAYRVAGQPLEAAKALDETDGLLKDPKQRLANQVALLYALGAMGPADLQRLAASGSGDLRGWAQLALLFGSAGAADASLDQRYAAWRRDHGSHPALAELPRAYFSALAGAYATGDRLAVLLPSSGGFAAGAFGTAIGAIREGILAAQRADDPAKRPQVSFVDASQAGRSRALVNAAAAGGAKYVVGPLQKPAVDSLSAGQGLPVPTLALNRATREGKPPANLFQYALSPDDEGASVAHAAWSAGHRSALVLYPNAPWADRLVQAFRAQWAALGGRIAGQKSYGTGRAGPDAAVDGLLGASAGTARGDAFVFLVATRESARAIWPKIRTAGGPPTYATSLVYPGDFDPAADQALAGLYFVDIPWMLADDDGPLSRRALGRALPKIGGSDQRLYAMGIDAYGVAPRVADLARRPGSFYPGLTGALRVDPAGRVQRQLVLGQYTASGVVLAAAPGAAR
jgi:outer membrane PBP1 activator LpoA protein